MPSHSYSRTFSSQTSHSAGAFFFFIDHTTLNSFASDDLMEFQFEAAIQEGRESLVHHMEVFHCEAPRDEVIPEYQGPCSDPDRPAPTRVCKRVLAAWAYGAGPFVYPIVFCI